MSHTDFKPASLYKKNTPNVRIIALPRTGSIHLSLLLSNALGTTTTFIDPHGRIEHTHIPQFDLPAIRTFRRDIVEWIASLEIANRTQEHNYIINKNEHAYSSFASQIPVETINIKAHLDLYQSFYSEIKPEDSCLFYEDWINDLDVLEKTLSIRILNRSTSIGKIPIDKWKFINREQLQARIHEVDKTQYTFKILE